MTRSEQAGPMVPLIVRHLFAEYVWMYHCPAKPGESINDAFRRVYQSLIKDLLPPFGQPRIVFLADQDGRIDLRNLPTDQDQRDNLLLNALPTNLRTEASLFVRLNLQTPSGHIYEQNYDILISLEESVDGPGVGLMISLDGEIFRPPDPDEDDALFKQQHRYNGPRLTAFLTSLHTELDAVFVGRDSNELGPYGYLPPDADQTGLPEP